MDKYCDSVLNVYLYIPNVFDVQSSGVRAPAT